MKFSSFCLPTFKEVPSDVKLKSHELMIRSGMIRMETSGIYTWLPLGLRVLNKINDIIIKEHQKFNINQILMPTIQSAEIWKKSERYDSYGAEMLKIKDRHEKELVYGPTNEEMMTVIGSNVIRSYKNFPISFFHIQSKFRDEIRPRFGVMRAREFIMKDAYSFDLTLEDLKKSYELFYNLYLNIFNKLGLEIIPVKALSGEIGGDLSHEFHVICESGESEIYFDGNPENIETQKINYDFFEKNIFVSTTDYAEEKKMNTESFTKTTSIELGHIFAFGDKYTKKLKFLINTPNGNINPLMGSYGIGISRIPAASIEINNDSKGIIWPKEISPFDLIIINLKPNDENCFKFSNELYSKLLSENFDVLYDDRDERVGVKFSDSDLIGVPFQIIIGSNYLSDNKIQIKNRKNGQELDIETNNVIQKINSFINDDQ